MTQSRRARIATTVLEIVFLGLGYRCLKGQALCNIDDYFYADGTSGVTDAAGFSTIMEYPLFLCEVGAFVEGFDMDENIYYQIVAVRFNCTDGNISQWYGRYEQSDHPVTFDLGLTAVQSQTMVELAATSATTQYFYFPYMGMLSFDGYDLTTGGLIASSAGPFATGGDYNSDITYSDCSTTGLNAFAVGAVVWASDDFFFGIKLMCAEVTPTCYPPDYPDPPTPAPVGAISDPPEVGNGSDEDDARWFDAAWEIVITVVAALVGTLVTTVVALMLRRCSNVSYNAEEGTSLGGVLHN